MRSLPPPPDGLTETDVGIAGFVNDAPGFSGLFRERFSDFLVHEVGPDGEVARLPVSLEVDVAGQPVARLYG